MRGTKLSPLRGVWASLALGLLVLPGACQTVSETAPETAKVAEAADPISVIAPELRAAVAGRPATSFSTPVLNAMRAAPPPDRTKLPDGVELREIPGPDGAPPVTVLIAGLDESAETKPAFLHIHGGGYIIYSAFFYAARLPQYAEACECVVVSVDYRLAPETSFPGPMEDNFAALKWLYDNAADLNVDPSLIAIGGDSAGGGHTAQLSFAARERGIPLAYQVLIYPMLDDRTGGVVDVPDHIGHYIWTEGSNQFAWSAYLGQPAGSDTVPGGAVPARVEDLTGLPPAWIGVGGADLFLLEDLKYAGRLAEAGVPVEMLVIPGAYHAFDVLAPASPQAQRFTASWQAALHRALHPAE